MCAFLCNALTVLAKNSDINKLSASATSKTPRPVRMRAHCSQSSSTVCGGVANGLSLGCTAGLDQVYWPLVRPPQQQQFYLDISKWKGSLVRDVGGGGRDQGKKLSNSTLKKKLYYCQKRQKCALHVGIFYSITGTRFPYYISLRTTSLYGRAATVLCWYKSNQKRARGSKGYRQPCRQPCYLSPPPTSPSCLQNYLINQYFHRLTVSTHLKERNRGLGYFCCGFQRLSQARIRANSCGVLAFGIYLLFTFELVEQ